WLGSREVITERITLGQFVVFFWYLRMLAWPMIGFGWVSNMLQRGLASWKRMLEVLETEPAIADVPGASAPVGIRGEIEFRNLTFAYGSSTPVLEHITARIPAGQTVAIVGGAGSGKATLTKLRAGLD